MARLDRARFDNGEFPFVCEIQTRFSDLDVVGHVNNVSATSIFQEARSRFAHEFKIVDLLQGQMLVVAAMTIEFANDMFHPEPVYVSTGLLEIGRTSYRLGQMVRQNDRSCAYAEIVQVASRDGKPAPFNDDWRAKLESLKVKYSS